MTEHDKSGELLARPAAEMLQSEQDSATHADESVANAVSNDETTRAEDDLCALAPSDSPQHLGHLDHYEVLQLIGKGGFGTVYRAFDTKLHRIVAIKVLAPELAQAVAAQRERLDLDLLARAYQTSARAHSGQKRASGDDFVSHSVAVATILAEQQMDTTTIAAALWYCDLRGFTGMSEAMPRDEVIATLNDWFGTMAESVHAHGGQVLKFIGDAMLAIFPLENAAACHKALQAAVEARTAMRELNARRRAAGQSEIGYGIALHVGDVMYGNIGAASRLDFTVIGPAVNVATRLESLSKELRRHVLLSGPFANLCGCSAEFLTSLGHHHLRGIGAPLEVFGLVDDD